MTIKNEEALIQWLRDEAKKVKEGKLSPDYINNLEKKIHEILDALFQADVSLDEVNQFLKKIASINFPFVQKETKTYTSTEYKDEHGDAADNYGGGAGITEETHEHTVEVEKPFLVGACGMLVNALKTYPFKPEQLNGSAVAKAGAMIKSSKFAQEHQTGTVTMLREKKPSIYDNPAEKAAYDLLRAKFSELLAVYNNIIVFYQNPDDKATFANPFPKKKSAFINSPTLNDLGKIMPSGEQLAIWRQDQLTLHRDEINAAYEKYKAFEQNKLKPWCEKPTSSGEMKELAKDAIKGFIEGQSAVKDAMSNPNLPEHLKKQPEPSKPKPAPLFAFLRHVSADTPQPSSEVTSTAASKQKPGKH